MSGSEIVVILLLALIVLGPEKLPEAIRKFGRVYSEIRKISNGFQSEFKNAFDEPMKELRETAQLTRDAVLKPLKDEPAKPKSETPQSIVRDADVVKDDVVKDDVVKDDATPQSDQAEGEGS